MTLSGRQLQVYEVLLLQIIVDKELKGIVRKGDAIYTGQLYKGMADADMSLFANKFAEILYKAKINGKNIVSEKGWLISRYFAGDTMNSFNTIANKTPGAGKSRKQRTPMKEWPKELREFFNKYHCAANVWLVPSPVGRTMYGPMNKARFAGDFMDLFLKLCIDRFESKDNNAYELYFKAFDGIDDFKNTHKINCYFDKNNEVIMFSDKGYKYYCEMAIKMMEKRAEEIATSEVSDELWEMFNSYGLIK